MIALVTSAALASCWVAPAGAQSAPLPAYQTIGRAQERVLEQTWYHGHGRWNLCANGGGCGLVDQDWAADSLIYALWLRWKTSGSNVVPIMTDVINSATRYTPTTRTWSDVPMWDAIAGAREYEVTRNQRALANAEGAFAYTDGDVGGNAFAAGSCPGIHYQRPHGEGNGLKTLETDSNYIKAAILLYEDTKDASYLKRAESMYASVRAWYFEPETSLYTVYIFDQGSSCSRVPHQYFSSVNGNMIWNGHELGKITGKPAYKNNARASEHAVLTRLSDAAGVFESLLQENDTSEELIEAMWALAADGDSAAKKWIVTNMAAAVCAEAPSGVFGRFFGGMPPIAKTSAWAAAGGMSLAFAAAALEPAAMPATGAYWAPKRYAAHDLTVTSVPGRFTFTGRAVSLVGTLETRLGHIEVYLDGVETANQIGINQAYPTSAGTIPDTVLFAWRWPRPGTHTIELRPPTGAQSNVKQGDAWFRMRGYYYVP